MYRRFKWKRIPNHIVQIKDGKICLCINKIGRQSHVPVLLMQCIKNRYYFPCFHQLYGNTQYRDNFKIPYAIGSNKAIISVYAIKGRGLTYFCFILNSLS